jgi:hypothetical protein
MLHHRPAGKALARGSSQGDGVAVLAVAGVLAAELLFLYLIIPVPHPISFEPEVNMIGTGLKFYPPTGSSIQCYWSVGNGPEVELVVVDLLGDQLYYSHSSGGSFAFIATHPPYFVFSFGGEVQVTGTYYSPML